MPFQSTLPMRGGTEMQGNIGQLGKISIHPPHAGRDCSPPCWMPMPDISIHPPHAGRDTCRACATHAIVDFNPPSPCGEGRKIL